MDKLKSCPFCDSLELFCATVYESKKRLTVRCQECKAEGPYRDTEDDAVDAWNTREREKRIEADNG